MPPTVTTASISARHLVISWFDIVTGSSPTQTKLSRRSLSTNPASRHAGTFHAQTLMSPRSLLSKFKLSARIRDYAVTTTSATHISLSGRILTHIPKSAASRTSWKRRRVREGFLVLYLAHTGSRHWPDVEGRTAQKHALSLQRCSSLACNQQKSFALGVFPQCCQPRACGGHFAGFDFQLTQSEPSVVLKEEQVRFRRLGQRLVEDFSSGCQISRRRRDSRAGDRYRKMRHMIVSLHHLLRLLNFRRCLGKFSRLQQAARGQRVSSRFIVGLVLRVEIGRSLASRLQRCLRMPVL